MTRKDYSEDLLIQAPTAELLEHELGWKSVPAYNDENFGPDSQLGRSNDTEVVMKQEVLAAALKRLNPGLPTEVYAQVLQDNITKTLIALNAYDAHEINLKANAVFAHIYTAGFGEDARVYH